MVDYYFKNSIETKIFINPEKLTEAIKKDPPKIVALANYMWNQDINSQVLKFTKSVSKNIIGVMGGPYFGKNDKPWLEKYFKINSSLDFYVSGEGEWKFIELVKQSLKHSFDVKKIVKDNLSPDIFFRNEKNEIVQGAVPLKEVLDHRYKDTRKKNLDTIQSPYLTGKLDEFFEVDGMVPMIETVRGCPYGCTFCCWGDPSLSRLSAFSEERVYQELDYIVKRVKSTIKLIMADGNFGILKRDIELAKYIRKLNEKYSWPKNVYLYFAKNSNDNVVKIAGILGRLIKVTLARQTMSEEVLKNIKRRNISDEVFQKIQQQLAAGNIDSMVELLYPLPGETRKSFIEGLDNIFRLMDILHTEVRFYPTELLPGSEMATTESREKFGLKTAKRVLWGSNKNFGNVTGCEHQEIVHTTNTFSFEDFVYVRKLHYLICLFATYKIYQPIVKLYQSKGFKHSFIWFIDQLIIAMEKKSDLMSELFQDFTKEVTKELIPMDNVTTGKEMETDKKKVNIQYILVLLYGKDGKYRKAFSETMKNIFIENSLSTPEEFDKELNKIEENFIDYIKIQKEHKSNNFEKVLAEFPNDTLIAEFVKCTNGVGLVETLYKMYELSSNGHVQMLVQKKHTRSENKPGYNMSLNQEENPSVEDQPIA